MATNKDSLSDKLLDGFAGTKNSLNTTKLATTIAQGISKRLSNVGNKSKFLGGKTVGTIDTALYTSVQEGQYQRLRRGDGVADVAAKLVNLIILSAEEKKLHHELDRNFEQEELDEAKKLEEINIEPETIVTLDDKTIFDSYNKLNLVSRLGKLWDWSKNITSWIFKKFKKLGKQTLLKASKVRRTLWRKVIRPGAKIIQKVGGRALKSFAKYPRFFGAASRLGPAGMVVGGAVMAYDIASTIAAGESGKQAYHAANKYKVPFHHEKGEVAGAIKGGIPGLEQMTVGEIRQLQNEDKVFAVGKYQMVPKTLQESIDLGFVKESDTFNKDTQEKLFKEYLISGKPGRESIDKYLYADEDDPQLQNYLSSALLDLAQEFASVEDPRQPGSGRSVYKNQTASISTEEAAASLILLREDIQDESQDKQVNKQITQIDNEYPTGVKLNESSIDYNHMVEDEQFNQNMLIINNNNTIMQPLEGNGMSMTNSTSQDSNLYKLSNMMVYAYDK